jgi:serpin B
MRKNIWFFLGLALGAFALSFLSGCSRIQSTLSPVASAGNNNTASTVYTPSQSCNMLSSNLYNFYQNSPTSSSGNIFFSPFSIITALAMAQEGAVGPTQTQMQKVLGLNPNTQARLQGFQQLISQINSPSQPYTLATADNLWPQQNFPILPSFVNTLQTYYDSGVTALNYNLNSAGAAQTIDGAVSQETDGYIPQLLTAADVPPGTGLVLTNAIYFNANWQSQFNANNTAPATFTLPTGATESVSMMHQTLSGVVKNYNGAANVFAMPYSSYGAYMYIFLPPLGGMAALESQLSGPNLNAWLAANSAVMTAPSTSVTLVVLSLPKFTFSTTYQLAPTLSTMGMPLAFSSPGPNGANFSGIDGNLDLSISKVIHQAYINVAEKGTTAAAATAVIITVTTGVAFPLPPPPPTIPFNVDQPFIFMIVDNASNTVLFMGRVNDPLSAN